MSTTIRTSTGPRWGSSGFTSSTSSLKVGRTSTTYYRGRIGFDSIISIIGQQTITSIKLYMNRTDEYSSKVLEIGICASADWSPTFNQSKDISVSKGTGSKSWDLTSWASTILGYIDTWYLHVRHGSGTNSYCEFQGGTSGSCPRLVIECGGNTITVNLSGTDGLFTVGSQKGITVTGNFISGSCSLGYTMGSVSETIHNDMSSGDTYNWLIPNTLISQFDTSVTDTITIIATASYGGQTIQNTFDFPITLPSDYAPVIDSSPVPQNAYGESQSLVQNRSALQFVVDAEGKYEAEIVRYDVSLCNENYTSADADGLVTNVLTQAGQFTALVSVTDSRGSTTSEEVPITVLAYSQPVIASVSLYRANEANEEMNDGTCLGYHITGQVSQLDGTHPGTVTLQWKPSGEAEYDYQNVEELTIVADDAATGTDPNVYYFKAIGAAQEPSLDANALDVRISVVDGMDSLAQGDYSLPSRSILLDILASGDGLAVGKISVGKCAEPTGPQFDVAEDGRFGTDVLVGGALMASPVGKRMVLLENDFQNVSIFSPFRASTPGGGSVLETAGETNHPGVVVFRSDTANPSGYSCMTDEGAFLLAGGEIARLKFSPMSVANLVMRFGFCDAFASQGSTVVDGVYMNVSGSTLTGKTSNNSVTLNGTTAKTFSLVVETWYDATVEVKYVNGVLTGVFTIRNEAGGVLWTDSLTTNIPTGAGRNVGAGVVVMRAATTTTSMIKIDYFGVGILRDLTR